jgi:hypothetical protein
MNTIDIVCIACGTPFITTRATRGRLPRFCSPDCRQKRRAAQHQQYRDEGRYPPPNRRPFPKACAVCGQPFKTTNRATVCCGMACGKVLAARKRNASRSARSIGQRQRVCVHCGDGFVARHPSGKARAGKSHEGKFCSRRCKDAAATTRPARQIDLFRPSEERQKP